MKWHDCISYARSHRAESGVGAWYCYSPFLVNVWWARKWNNVQNRDPWLYKTTIIINFVCFGEERWGRYPPRVKDPNFILSQTYVSSDESSRKCRKACEAYGETLEIHNPNKHTGFNKENSSEYWRVVQ